MNADQALIFLAALLTLPSGQAATTTDESAAKAAILQIAAAAGLDVEGFVFGDPGERFLEYSARAMAAWGTIPIAAVRALFFALATDPGDVDDFGVPDGSLDQTPRPGMLSAMGLGTYGTGRGGQTYATTFITLRNSGTTPTTPFTAGQLDAEYTAATRADGGTPTYRSTADPSIYAGIGGTLPPLAPNATVTLPFQAQQIGVYGSAPSNAIDHIITQSFGTLTVIASTTAIGEEREPRPAYITRCLFAADKLAKGGTVKGVAYAATTQVDPATGEGTPLLDYSTGDVVAITGALVLPDSSANTISVYFYGLAGPVASATNIASANGNIQGVLLTDSSGVSWNPAPLGVVPETVTYSGVDSIATPITVTYSARISASAIAGGAAVGTYTSGGSPPANIAAIFTQIATALGAWLPAQGPGGQDAVAGVGVIYTPDIQDTVKDSVSGLRNVVLTAPSSPTTAIILGHIATISVSPPNGTLVVV